MTTTLSVAVRRLEARVEALEQQLETMRNATTLAEQEQLAKFDAVDHIIHKSITEPAALFTPDLMTTEDVVAALDYHYAHKDPQFWQIRRYGQSKKETRSHYRKIALRLSRVHELTNIRMIKYISAAEAEEQYHGDRDVRHTTVWILRNADKYQNISPYELGRIHNEQKMSAGRLFQQRHAELIDPNFNPHKTEADNVTFL